MPINDEEVKTIFEQKFEQMELNMKYLLEVQIWNIFGDSDNADQ